MKKTTKRVWSILGLLAVAATGLGLLMYAFQGQMQFYYTPTQLAAGEAPEGRVIRAGGMVVAGSIERLDGLRTRFTLTDYDQPLAVLHQGLLPPMFREGQGVVAVGTYNPAERRFYATELITKHDENYMPPEVARSLKKSHDAR